TASSGLHREESRRPLQDVPLVTEHPHLPPQPPQLLPLVGRQSVPFARVHGRLLDPPPHRGLAQVHLAANRRQRAIALPDQGNDLSLERRRERSPGSSAGRRLLHLPPHLNTLLVGSRPHLRCQPTGGKSRQPDYSFRKSSGLVGAPGRRVGGAKGENPHCRPY